MKSLFVRYQAKFRNRYWRTTFFKSINLSDLVCTLLQEKQDQDDNVEHSELFSPLPPTKLISLYNVREVVGKGLFCDTFLRHFFQG